MWYIGTMNDGLFIINTPSRPSTDEAWSMILNVTELPAEKAILIVEAHNAALVP